MAGRYISDNRLVSLIFSMVTTGARNTVHLTDWGMVSNDTHPKEIYGHVDANMRITRTLHGRQRKQANTLYQRRVIPRD